MSASIPRGAAAGAVALLLMLAAGCGKGPPAVTEVEGVVLLNDRPLPSALVEFIPEAELGPEWVSSGVTDKDGKFTLSFTHSRQPGAVVSRHRVVVRDAPPPPEARGMSGKAQQAQADYAASLSNRPIPAVYRTAGSTPLREEVTSEKKNYELKLTRQ